MSNCYSCKFKRNIPGNNHISCAKAKNENSASLMLVSILDRHKFQQILNQVYNFSVPDYAITSGWFQFPMNFDPSWIQGKCSQFEQIEIKQVS